MGKEEISDVRGCTANVLFIKDNTIFCANAGDSRCVMAVNGKAIPLSVDHKPQNLSEKTRILKAGSTINQEGRIDGNLNLSRAIGDLKYKKNKNLKP
jgi:serine/threonine protein phosphatase PrpC